MIGRDVKDDGPVPSGPAARVGQPRETRDAAALGAALLAWFDENRRDLPWRTDRTPYKVWVSEIMLQQTRVEAVVPYYYRFLAAFPTIDHLAAAPEADVLKVWEGLGYYSRARNLHKAAKEVRARYGGRLPPDAAELRTLPGIGAYTAGAIASIAFGEPTPAVDGNVLRVIARLVGVEDVITTAAARRRIEEQVAAMMPAERPGDMTEALMELGALVCLPRNPSCGRCPWRGDCVALAEGLVEELPRRPVRTPPKIVRGAVAVVESGGGATPPFVFVRRRPAEGLLAGMWEFPWVELGSEGAGSDRGHPPDGVQGLLAEECGLPLQIVRRLPPVRHVFSHLEWRLDVFFCTLRDAGLTGLMRAGPPGEGASTVEERGLWVEEEQLSQLPFGRAHRRIADAWLGVVEEGRG